MTSKHQCQDCRTVQNSKQQEQIEKMVAAHFQIFWNNSNFM